MVKPARLSLARVSILRGEGTMAGVPFIDAYVQQAEPVVDYLTRYSGLHPGDLDPSVSRHHITTMKAAYLQLRQLVDAGCRFVGHVRARRPPHTCRAARLTGARRRPLPCTAGPPEGL